MMIEEHHEQIIIAFGLVSRCSIYLLTIFNL